MKNRGCDGSKKECEELQSRLSYLEAFWNWAREADKAQFEAECRELGRASNEEEQG